jgi:hypothetical protein
MLRLPKLRSSRTRLSSFGVLAVVGSSWSVRAAVALSSSVPFAVAVS